MEPILQFARRLSRPFDLEEVLVEIVESGRRALSADRASVLLLDRDTGEFYSQATSDGEVLRFPADRGIAGETLRSGVLRIDDCYSDPRFNREVDQHTGYRTKNMISVSLVGVDEQAVGVMQLLNAEKGHFDGDDEVLAETFAGFAAMAIQRAQALEDRIRTAQLERDLDVARDIQMALLPQSTPEVHGYRLATFFAPADETGGDIFDLFPYRAEDEDEDEDGNGLTLLLADATGHGIGAAVSVTQVRSMLRMGSLLSADLDALCLHLNNQLVEDLPSGKFVTAFVGRLLPARHRLDYRSLGQAPLLHYVAKDDQLRWLAASSVPMGLFENPPLPRPDPIHLGRGDLFVLLSDGFYEQTADGAVEMGRERVGEIVRRHSGSGAGAVVESLCEALRSFADGRDQEDDLTAMVLERVDR